MSRRDRRLVELVEDNSDFIINALHVHADHMAKSAADARVQYARGQADSATRAEQDKSMITNQGYRMSAEVFDQSSATARKLALELTEVVEEED